MEQIKDPKELSKYTEDQIFRDPNSNKIFLKDSPTVNEGAGTTGDLSGTLSTDQTDFDALRLFAKGQARTAQAGAGQRGFDIAKEAGLELFDPASIRAAAGIGESTKLDIKDIYQYTLERIDKMEENKKEGNIFLERMASEASYLFDKDSPFRATSNEIEAIIQTGFAPKSLLIKMSQYKLEHPEEDRNHVESLRNTYWDAGILLTDTPAEASAKVEQNSGIFRKQMKGTGDKGTGDGGVPKFTSSQKLELEAAGLLNAPREQQIAFLFPQSKPSSFIDIMQQNIDAGFSPEVAAREAAAYSEQQGISVNQETLSNWSEQARKLTKTPIESEEVTLSPIEQDIANFSSDIFTPGQIRGILQSQHRFTPEEINSSSVGGFGGTLANTGSNISSFFVKLFGG